ncbi:D-alanyl-D-alanine carboxypeptidase family protein [Actinacidiphila alni]|uniref:D-alanyl-D-alanine carboxypeptidase family protein n=1 Tax=Actinacidiphila alni TaxID=380248 RepID=UPI001FE913E0|nr:serine hydrolase [Actinacidiphila alni]
MSVTAVTAAAVLLSGAFAAPAGAATVKAPTISARGGFVMNDGTGRTLFSKAADTRRSTGSTTKIMTARVVLAQRHLDLDAKVTVSKAYRDYITAKGASSAGLVVGDRPTVRQLMYAMLLPSGCDAAYALADRFGSGRTRAARVKSFIGRMNSTARSLGLKNTHFDSFDGIGNGANYSSPRDLTKIASSAMKYATFRTVVRTRSTKQRVLTAKGGHRTMSWANTDKLLGSYPGAIGVKTGSGPVAGYCLVFAATRGKKTVVGTVLGAPSLASRTADAKKLMDYGFRK